MFWGLHVKASPKVAQPVEYLFPESVKLSQVALEPPMSTRVGKANTPNGTKNKKGKNQSLVESPQSDTPKVAPVSLVVEHDDKQFVLCTLDPDRNWQCPLDLVFQAGTSVKFSLRGHGTLHLTGYEIPDDDDEDMISFDEEDDEDVDEDSEMEVTTKAKPDKKAKGKKAHTNGVAKGDDEKNFFIHEPIFLTKPSHDDDDDDDSSEDLDFEADSDDVDEESDMEEDDSVEGAESDESEDE